MGTFNTDINPSANKTYSLGTTSTKWKLNGYVAEIIKVDVSATSSTSTSVSNSAITANHIVINDLQVIPDDVTWTTSSGSVALSCSNGIPAMTLYLGVKD